MIGQAGCGAEHVPRAGRSDIRIGIAPRPTSRDAAREGSLVRDAQIGRMLRALRHRRGWRQADLAARAGIARSVISDMEAGNLGGHALEALRMVVAVCGGAVLVDVRVPGGDASRLLDADHARVQSAWAERLRRHGWHVSVEVTFNHYGDRGSIDILAWHPGERVLVVAEVKTVIVDAQELLASIDRKTRVAVVLARRHGWRPAAIVPALLVREGASARRRIGEHAPLFARFNLAGRAAQAWLRRPSVLPSVPSGIVCFTNLSDARSGDRRRAGRQRIRLTRDDSRSGTASTPPNPPSERA
jgi:transcriptional regulator with XRE-family HTH domain